MKSILDPSRPADYDIDRHSQGQLLVWLENRGVGRAAEKGGLCSIEDDQNLHGTWGLSGALHETCEGGRLALDSTPRLGFDPHASRFKDPFGLLFEELDSLSTRLGMSILLVAANAEIDSVVEGYAAYHLDPIPFGADFLAVLRAFERWACLHRPSNLHEEPTARYIHERTAGLIGRVDRLISDCARHAIDNGEECITIDLMERCFKRDEWSW